MGTPSHKIIHKKVFLFNETINAREMASYDWSLITRYQMDKRKIEI